MLEKKIPFLMNNLLKKENIIDSNSSSEIKKFKGILPEDQLKTMFENELDDSNTDLNINLHRSNPNKDQSYLVKQSTVRQNLITEVDTNNINSINKKQNG